ncbi:PEP-CTERM sorting domain-containing protein [Planktothricoides raciborskii]|uniref:PEP-CTERM sorting domain-containing protein n=1 Tax=Planktothricoides raciborskii FACHB-1370 TaxID=2949576 RepID=A0ABR8EJ30_9CYAN|nr:PEP-CTERM sorting domain-containing protein [Planktothricoides raciborskii]MBD2546134.1 PEP-CTERM sorting domain-containing protein [Planktothricoides raciborskii FACHB-1370]MBD2583868.1 PEP-CTERM sorting domain-containing protein [Planktothricoides raciborskii FACHB-1261]
MKTLQTLGLGTSFIAATVTVATVVAVAPAQAALLNGGVGLSGDLDINNTASGFVWKFSENVVNDKSGDFAGLSFPADGSLPQINDLAFTCGVGNPTFCTTDPVTPLISFGTQTIKGTTAELTFNLDATQYLSFGVPGVINTTASFPYLTGAFKFNGATLAVGQLSGGYTNFGSNQNSTYQMTLATKDVPEPLTIMGSGFALGFGGLFQRKNAAKRKNQKSA